MKKEITFEQIIGLIDATINLAREDCNSIKIYVNKEYHEYYRIDIVPISDIKGDQHHYTIQYNAIGKLIGLVDRDCLDYLEYDDIRINNSQEDLLFDKINALDDMWYFNSINNINKFISNYASKK